MSTKAYLEITLKIADNNRPSAAKVYSDYREPFLNQIQGALSKELLIREEDVQVLHGFTSADDAKAYLNSKMFNDDVVVGLKPFLEAQPDIRIYSVV